MPKLANLKDNIANIEQRLKGSDTGLSAEEIERIVSQSINTTSAQNAQTLSFQVEKALIATLGALEERQNKARSELADALTDMLSVINDNDRVLNDRLSSLDKKMGGQGESLSDTVTASSKELRELVAKSAKDREKVIGEVKDLIGSLPTSFPTPEKPDLKFLETMVTALVQKANEVKPVVLEWDLEIERDVNQRITNVNAKAVV